MAQRLKRWESPRRQGRNDKGKGGSARKRQLKKQQQMLRRKLKDNPPKPQSDNYSGEEFNSSFFNYSSKYFIPDLVYHIPIMNEAKQKKGGFQAKKEN
ncbi:MAG: hypothetical protein AB4058_12765 [Microcystaceae cyanobacterium]